MTMKTHAHAMSWCPKKITLGNMVMKNVCVPSVEELTKYTSRNGRRTRSSSNVQYTVARHSKHPGRTCMAAMTLDSQTKFLTSRFLIVARHPRACS